MKTVVFGGTGFIGSHVVEQLQLAGHQVTAVVRTTSDSSFLEKIGIPVKRINFAIDSAIADALKGNEVVYNCTADAVPPANIDTAYVEIELTKKLVAVSSKSGVSRFVQLSTIILYDFNCNKPMDELYPTQPEYAAQKVALAREKVIEQFGRKNGMATVVLRPASTIGVRDKKSFFSRLFTAHSRDQFPMAGQGSAKMSMVDTRDLGRAMVWLGTVPLIENDNGIYLLKGFDTTWQEFKDEMDRVIGRRAGISHIPADLTDDQMVEKGISPFTVKSLSMNRIWDDQKLRNTGFEPKYSLGNAVDAAVRSILDERKMEE